MRSEVAEKDLSIPGLILNREQTHAFRNRLNEITLRLFLTEQLLKAGRSREVPALIGEVLDELSALNHLADPSPDRKVRIERDNSVPPTALLVEDDLNERELLAAYLRMHGFRVEVVVDGVDAIEFLSRGPLPDLVLLDLGLPRLSGADTVHSIREDPHLHALTIYAISGSQPDELGIPFGEHGVDRWFSKPLNPESLVKEIRSEFAVVPDCL